MPAGIVGNAERADEPAGTVAGGEFLALEREGPFVGGRGQHLGDAGLTEDLLPVDGSALEVHRQVAGHVVGAGVHVPGGARLG